MNRAYMNPLFVKEVRTLFRGKGFPIVLNSYLGLITLILVAGAVMALGKYYTTSAWEMGRNIVLGLGIYQLIALTLIAPSLTAASMSLERDRDTYDVLMVMPLGLTRIVFYKTLASLMFLVMLVMTSLPLLAGGFVLGGVAPGEIAAVAILTLLAVLAGGALGLMFSSLFKRTIIAVPGACLAAGFLMVLSAFWIYTWQISLTVRYANPIIALVDRMEGAQVGFFETDLPVWVPTTFFLGIACLLCLAIATEGFRFKFRRRYAAVGGSLLLLCAAMLFFALGEALRSMPEALDKGAVFQLSLHLLAFVLLASVLDPLGMRSSAQLYQDTRTPLRRALTGLFCPGLGLTLTLWIVLSGIWGGVSMFYPAMYEPSGILAAPPLLVGAIALFYAATGRVVAGIRRWKRGYWVRIITNIAFLLWIGAPHVVSIILHAADNQATAQPLDMLLYVSPLLACRSLGEDVLAPYPFLENQLNGTDFYWVSIAAYALLALLMSLLALFLNRRKNARPVYSM